LETEELQLRIYGNPTQPVLVYLPGLHGDWTLVTGFRAALRDRVRFVEITYPRSLTWSIDDYANNIEDALLSRGITRGWLLGESFGSQIVWPLVEKNLPANAIHQTSLRRNSFKVDGVILAGGFVKHPWKWGPGLMRRMGEKTSMEQYQRELKFFVWYKNFRHRGETETLASIQEFVARRTHLDRQAMRARLLLLDQYDPRLIAQQTNVPVHYLAGLIDPLVPWVLVRWWLRRNCPGYRGGKTFWLADHNMLESAPVRSADFVVKWMKSETPKP
jgi:pimeloyl-ACP methyl ester carboxylesterase